jgi:hypothetical protein
MRARALFTNFQSKLINTTSTATSYMKKAKQLISTATHEATAKTGEFLLSAGHKIQEQATHANMYTKEAFIIAGHKIQVSAEATSTKAKEVLSEAVSVIKKAFIGSHSEAPAFIQDNEYITTGYRIDHTTCLRASRSLFTCHNKTVNVWTHLLGSAVALIFFKAVAVIFAPIDSSKDRLFLK